MDPFLSALPERAGGAAVDGAPRHEAVAAGGGGGSAGAAVGAAGAAFEEDGHVPWLLRDNSLEEEAAVAAIGAGDAASEAVLVEAAPAHRRLAASPSPASPGRGGSPARERLARTDSGAELGRRRVGSAAHAAAVAAGSDGARVLVAVVGHRGDVQPAVALAFHLLAHHMDVRFCVSEGQDRLVAHYLGEERTHVLPGDPSKVFSGHAFRDAYYNPDASALERLQAGQSELERHRARNYAKLWRLADSFAPHVLLASVSMLPIAAAIAQKLAVPVLPLSPIPVHPTGDVGPVSIGSKPGGNPLWNKLQYWLLEKMVLHVQCADVKAFQEERLGIPVHDLVWVDECPTVLSYSERVFPSPHDWPADALPPFGYFPLPELAADEPHTDVEAFLAAGPKPIYVGFGSLPLEEPSHFVEDLDALMDKLGMRAVFCAPQWMLAEVKAPPSDRMCMVSDVRHQWLFPQCALAVHHGGAGTTGASLTAGIPTVVVWMLADQAFWARRVLELGVGHSEVLSMLHFSPAALERQIVAALHPDVVAKAHALGLRLRAERGLQRAYEFICNQLAQHGNPDGVRCEWMRDDDVPKCPLCDTFFTLVRRRHHCRRCGGIFCSHCMVEKCRVINWPGDTLLCNPCHDATATAATPPSGLPATT